MNRRELVYKTVGEQQLSLIFLPPLEQKFERAPVYFIIPGGGWHRADHRAMCEFSGRSAEALRRRGWAVASVTYRLIPEATLSQIVSDCMDAARYLSQQADVLGIDARRIVSSGHSAGGHLALMLALAPHGAFTAQSPYDAVANDFTVVASAPMSPLTVLYPDCAGYAPTAFAIGERQLGQQENMVVAMHRASPIDYVTPCSVPLLLCCGTHDDLVYAEHSTHLYERCRTVGAPCEILYSHFGGHCFEPMVEGKRSDPDFASIQDAIAAFATKFEPQEA